MSSVYRRCSECDFWTHGTIRAADRSLADHQRSTGHADQGRKFGDEKWQEQPTASPDWIEAIEARTNAATEGPWEALCYDSGHSKYEKDCSVITEDLGDTVCDFNALARLQNDRDGKNDGEADANFIAHSRTDIPALIDRIRELEGMLPENANKNTTKFSKEKLRWRVKNHNELTKDRIISHDASLAAQNISVPKTYNPHHDLSNAALSEFAGVDLPMGGNVVRYLFILCMELANKIVSNKHQCSQDQVDKLIEYHIGRMSSQKLREIVFELDELYEQNGFQNIVNDNHTVEDLRRALWNSSQAWCRKMLFEWELENFTLAEVELDNRLFNNYYPDDSPRYVSGGEM